jgi:hypothetical protein
MNEASNSEVILRAECLCATMDPAVANQIALEAGKNLVVTGTAISITGVLIYCLSLYDDLGQAYPQLIDAGLVVIGAGVLCWLIGAVKYINAAIDSDCAEELF